MDLEEALDLAEADRADLVALDEALTELRLTDPAAAKLVELRYFAGLTMPEAAEVLGVSLRSAERNWTYAKTWLHRELAGGDTANPDPARPRLKMSRPWRGSRPYVALHIKQTELTGESLVRTHHSNAKLIFLDAVEIPSAAERRAYVVAACAGDDALFREIEELLRHHEGLGSFLEVAAAAPLATEVVPAASEGPGAILGPYKLLEQIGEGGFGGVFVAEQSRPMCRKVALKVLKPGMDTLQVVARFEAERQALALMDHVNIARVFDAGTTETGLPFFVMELVRGVPITDFCDENNLPVRARLELLLHVCRAVQHAHQKGVIHRDIKPSNVLVTLHDGTPVAKVIDFGIAKATGQRLTDKTLFTNFAQMIGSPLYMSPEQAEMSGLDIDTRTDIYSLGVLLYELLTGTTPFNQERLRDASFDEIRRIIRVEEPPKPSVRITTLGQAAETVTTRRHSDPRRLGQLFRGELDWVVMKCLGKDRNRRYETANGLARDVERYLHDEPVHACPPSALYRFRKFARRHKAGFAIASAAAIVVLLGVVGLAVSYTWVKGERDAKVLALAEKEAALAAAEANYAKAEEQRQAADESSRKARQAVDEFFTQVSESTLLDVPGLQPLRKELLEAALKYHLAFLEQRSVDPELRAEAAASYFRVAQIYYLLDQSDEAIRAVQNGLTLAEELVDAYADRPDLTKRLAGFYRSGRFFHRGGWAPSDPLAALQALTAWVGLWERLARDHPNVDAFQNDLAGTHCCLGELQLTLRRREEALASFQNAANIWERLGRDNPTVAEYQADLASAHNRIARLLRLANRTEDAEKAVRQALELRVKLVGAFPARAQYRLELAESYEVLGTLLTAPGRFPEAEAALARALAAVGKLAAEFPHVPAYQELIAVVYLNQGSLLRQQGRPHEGVAAYRQAQAGLDKLAAEFPSMPQYPERLAYSCECLSLLLADLGAHFEAEEAHRRALAVQESLVADFPAVARNEEQLCWIVVVWSAAPAREVHLAVDVATKAVAREAANNIFWPVLGAAQYRAGNWEAAQAALEKALALGASKSTCFFLAMLHEKRGNHEVARTYYRQAVQWMEEIRPRDQRLLRLRAEGAQLLGIASAAPAKTEVRKEEKRP